MTNVENMTCAEMIGLLTEFYEYDIDDIHEMTDDEFKSTVENIIDEFTESDLFKQIEESGLIDVYDPDNSIYDILKEWDDVMDEDDMYPNGKDDD